MDGANQPVAIATTNDETKPVEEIQRESLQFLGPSIISGWCTAAMHRRQSGMDDELLECLRQCKGEYSGKEQSNIEQTGQPLVYVQNSDRKRRDCNTLVGSVFINSSDDPWMLRPTPVPETSEEDSQKIAERTMNDYLDWQRMNLAEQGVPEQEMDMALFQTPPDPMVIEQYAKTRRDEMDNLRTENATKKVDRMTKKIKDQLLEGNWREAMTALVDNASSYGTGILKGPVRRNRKRDHLKNGKYERSATDVYECESISPMDCYPSKGAVNINDGDFYQRVRYTPRALNSMKKMGRDNGYFATEIDSILERFPNGGLVLREPIDSERKLLENDGTTNTNGNTQIEGIEAWCDVRGSLLIQQGILKTDAGVKIDETDYYEVNVVVIDNKVIFCTLVDEHRGRPLYKAVFYKIQGSWWGESPLKKMRDPARAFNATYRAKCVNNMMCSGFMAFYDVNALLAGTSLQLRPFGAYGYKNTVGNSTIPVKLVQAASNVDLLNADMREDAKLFDTLTGIPSAQHVQDASVTAGRTYNGLLLIVTASKEGANTVVHSLYLDVMKPFLKHLYSINLEFDPDDEIKGDAEVDAGGLLSILVKEQSINRLLEFLQQAQQPAVLKVIGESGLAEILREYMKLMQGINSDNIVPSRAEMQKRERMAALEAKVAKAEQMALQQQQMQMQQQQINMKQVEGAASSPYQEAPTQQRQPRLQIEA